MVWYEEQSFWLQFPFVGIAVVFGLIPFAITVQSCSSAISVEFHRVPFAVDVEFRRIVFVVRFEDLRVLVRRLCKSVSSKGKSVYIYIFSLILVIYFIYI